MAKDNDTDEAIARLAKLVASDSDRLASNFLKVIERIAPGAKPLRVRERKNLAEMLDNAVATLAFQASVVQRMHTMYQKDQTLHALRDELGSETLRALATLRTAIEKGRLDVALGLIDSFIRDFPQRSKQ